jgi:hypothetical protein
MALTTQHSIIIGLVAAGCIVGGALYLGLSHAGNRETSSAAPQPELRGPGQAAANAVTAGPSTAAPLDSSAVASAAKAQLELHRTMLMNKCWGQADGGVWRVTFNFTFDGAGRQLARGLAEDRASTRHDVTGCVNEALPEIRVSPPGATVAVQVPWSLP